MRKSISFSAGFMGVEANQAIKEGKKHQAFDWDKAAEIIKNKYAEHKDLVVEAGLEGDFDITSDVIFENGKPTIGYTYLSSNWATPSMILSYDGEEESIDCYTEQNERFHSHTTWDDGSLKILGIQIK